MAPIPETPYAVAWVLLLDFLGIQVPMGAQCCVRCQPDGRGLHRESVTEVQKGRHSFNCTQYVTEVLIDCHRAWHER